MSCEENYDAEGQGGDCARMKSWGGSTIEVCFTCHPILMYLSINIMIQ